MHTVPKTFAETSDGLDLERKRRLAMDYLELARSPEEGWALIHSVGADLDDDDVTMAVSFNRRFNWVDLEEYEVGHRDWRPRNGVVDEPLRVGDRVHWSPYTDLHPATVVQVTRSALTVWIREEGHRVIDPDVIMGGFAPVNGPNQKWECFENPSGPIRKATRRRDGKYRMVGASNNAPAIGWGWQFWRDPMF